MSDKSFPIFLSDHLREIAFVTNAGVLKEGENHSTTKGEPMWEQTISLMENPDVRFLLLGAVAGLLMLYYYWVLGQHFRRQGEMILRLKAALEAAESRKPGPRTICPECGETNFQADDNCPNCGTILVN